MIILKENISKQRIVYRLSDRVRKVYSNVSIEQIRAHVMIMDLVYPGYILDYGTCTEGVFLECIIVEGVACNTLEHTIDNINKVYSYCIENMRETYPYMHMDWAPSNILYDGKQFNMVDWDNIAIVDINQALAELDIDMRECYGSQFDLFIKHTGDNLASLRAPVLSIVSPVNNLL